MYSRHCAACGAELVEGTSFCANCGAPVETEGPGPTPGVDSGPSRCPSCGAEVAEDASFCASCGAPVQAEAPAATTPGEHCSACGAALPAGASFCGSCGAAVRAEGEVPLWAAPAAAEAEKVGFWRRAIGLGLIDFIVLRYVFLAIALFMVAAVTDPAETWILGAEDPLAGRFVHVYRECEPNPVTPVCFYYTNQDDYDTAETMAITFAIIWAAGLFVYLWIGNAGWRTMGKGLTGVRVVRKDSGQPLGPWRGLLRTLGYIVSLVPLGVGFLWAIWDKDKQTWHDKIAGSVVVRGEPSGCLVLLLWLIGIVGVGVLGAIMGAAMHS